MSPPRSIFQSINPKFQIPREFYQDPTPFEEPFVSLGSFDRDTGLSNFLPPNSDHSPIIIDPWHVQRLGGFRLLLLFNAESKWRFVAGRICQVILDVSIPSIGLSSHVHRGSLIFSSCRGDLWQPGVSFEVVKTFLRRTTWFVACIVFFFYIFLCYFE